MSPVNVIGNILLLMAKSAPFDSAYVLFCFFKFSFLDKHLRIEISEIIQAFNFISLSLLSEEINKMLG